MKNKSVLVVDDEELIVQTMRDDLRLVGYQVDVAYDAQQALGLFQEIQHDLVITDLHMKTVGGIELIRKLKDFNSRTRIIVITGYGTTESAIDSLRLKVDDFILKPYDRNDLLEKINTLFSGLTKKKIVTPSL
ncbi:response regulator [Nitrospina gracilis]|nr:response regulator [Nitrospina gracilis]